VGWFREEFAACDAEVRRHLMLDERVLAVGRCEDITELGGPEEGGISRSYVMITDRRLRWVRGCNLAFEASLDLDAITGFTERSLAHHYAISIQHPPLERRHLAPELSFPPEVRDRLLVEGRLRARRGPFMYTELAFSRRDTVAARTLRDAISPRLPI
jgi:hypothetical protein